MTTRYDMPWGRWIRLSVAHHYLGVDRRWFDRHVRPYCPVLKLSRQARAFPREDLDIRAATLEYELLGNPIDPTSAVVQDGTGDEWAVVKKGVSVWAKPERAASPPMPKVTRSSISRSTAKTSSPDWEQSVRNRPKRGLPTRSNVSGLPRNVDRVLASLSAKRPAGS